MASYRYRRLSEEEKNKKGVYTRNRYLSKEDKQKLREH